MAMLLRPLVICSALMLSAIPVAGQTRLEGERFETMRGLSHYLHEGSEFVTEEARERLRSRDSRERALVSALDRFNQRAQSFHQRMDKYAVSPWDVSAEVARLTSEARRVQTRLRRVRAASEISDDWDLVVEDLNLMRRLLRGDRVEVPAAHSEWSSGSGMDDRPGDHTHAPGQGHEDEGWGRSPFSGPRLEEFRRLAHDLDTRARRAHQLATTQRADSSQAGVQLVTDLQHFAERTAALHRQADADRLEPGDVGPVVQHLLEDARKADRSMRQARVYENTWDEWTATIRVLERMVAALR